MQDNQRWRKAKRRTYLIRRCVALTILGSVTWAGLAAAGSTESQITAQVEQPQDVHTQILQRQREMDRLMAEMEAENQRAAAEMAVRNYRREHSVLASRGGTRDFTEVPLLLPVGVESSGITAEQLNAVFAETGLAGLGDAFVSAEAKWRINAGVLAMMAAHESGWGTSEFARQRNNLFGYMAYTENPGQAKLFPSKEACIMEVAEWITKEYLSPEGRYYNGGTLAAIGPIWAADDWEDGDPSWAWKVAGAWQSLLRRIK